MDQVRGPIGTWVQINKIVFWELNYETNIIVQSREGRRTLFYQIHSINTPKGECGPQKHVCVLVWMYVCMCAIVWGCMYVDAPECEHVCGYMNLWLCMIMCECARVCACVCTAKQTQARDSKP